MARQVVVDEKTDWSVSWTIANEPMERSWHALVDDGRVWLVDPLEEPAALERAEELGPIAGVIQLLDRHKRAGEELADRYGVPLHRLPAAGALADTPFEVLSVLDLPVWKERALWWAERRALVVPETLGTAPYFAVAARRVGVHPLLRVKPPAGDLRRRPSEHLLVGHGRPLHGGAAGAINESVDASRRDAPQAMLQAARSFLRR